MSEEGRTAFGTESGGGDACVLEGGMALVGSLFKVPKQISLRLCVSMVLTNSHSFLCPLEKLVLVLVLPDPSSVFL
jgi:hypothetical protein